MNVKAVVKVMNFHALLRVDASRKRSETYNTMQEELEAMMSIIVNNRNLRLDKKVKLPDKNLPTLRIYIGSDMGFCGSVNSSVGGELSKDTNSTKIVIGKKVRTGDKETALTLTQEDFDDKFELIMEYLNKAVRERPWSAVEIVYNHFYNISSIKQIVKRIYPIQEKPAKKSEELVDFYIEENATELLEDMTVSYLAYEMRIAAASALASENVMRQNATSESLKKLEEQEAETVMRERKAKNEAGFRKTVDSFVKQKSLRENT